MTTSHWNIDSVWVWHWHKICAECYEWG